MNVFCYGTLIWPDIWQHTVRSEYAVKDAYLKSFKCRKVKGENFPALIRSTSADSDKDIVEGKVYFDINGEDFIRVQEHIGKQFEIIDGVCFTEGSNLPISVKIFLWKAEHRSLLSSETWTKEWFEEKALRLYRQSLSQGIL